MRDFTGVEGASGGLADNDTRWTPEVGNAIVQEIANVVRDPTGGDAALSPGDNDQLLTAILAMIDRAVSVVTANRKRGRYIVPLVAGGTYGVLFDEPFETDNVTVVAIEVNSTSNSTRDNWVQLLSWDRFGFVVVVQGSNTGGTNTLDGFHWVAEADPA